MNCNKIISVAQEGGAIYLGVWDTLNVKSQVFDVSPWFDKFGNGGTLTVLHQRRGDELPYEVASLIVDHGRASWIFDETDTAIVGEGSAALVYIVKNEVIARTKPIPTCVAPTLGMSGADVPDPWEAWYTRVLKAAAGAEAAQAAAGKSEANALKASEAANDAASAAETAQAAAEAAAEEAASAAENAAFEQINSVLGAVVAEEYDSGKNYFTGDLVTYEGGLFRFKDDHTGKGEDLDPEEVDAVTIAGELKRNDPHRIINDANISNSEVWSSKNIVDRLCPAFEERGTVVTCEPFADYPLSVTAQAGATTITRTGENVFGGEKLRDTLKKADNGGNVLINETEKTVQFDPGGINRSGAAFDKLKPNTRYTVILYGYNTMVDDGTSNMRIRYTDGTDEKLIFNNGKPGQTCSANELGYVIHTTKENKTVRDLLPIWANGKTKLYYEKCGVFEGVVSVDKFQAYIGASFANGESVPALKGVNTLWANSGEITVTGRKDITAMFEKLAAAVVAAGAN